MSFQNHTNLIVLNFARLTEILVKLNLHLDPLFLLNIHLPLRSSCLG